MIDVKEFDQIVKWTEKDYGTFQSGSRNEFVFALASKCCHKGIDKQAALHEITFRYKAKDFLEKEIRSSVESAYKRNGNGTGFRGTGESGSGAIKDSKSLNQEKRK